MANKIQFRRGLKANLPTLSVGEPAFTTDTNQFYIGNGTSNIEYGKKSEIGDLTQLPTVSASNLTDAINEINTKIISVKDKQFGAKGDGITDDTVAIQNAINYALSTCGKITIPVGRYRVGDLFINGNSGLDIIGERSPHNINLLGTVFIYTGTGKCINISDSGDFIYRVFIKNLAIVFEQNAQAGIYGKNLQECTFENIGIWAESKTVNVAYDLDGIGIINIDNCISSRCTTAVKGYFGVNPNPQANGGSNITRCNFYYCTNAFDLGYTLGLNIKDNWIEGFQNGILIGNSSLRAEVTGLNILGNFFVQSTPSLTETRALKIVSTNNSNAIRVQYNFKENFCYFNGSGATIPSYILSNNISSNTSGFINVYGNVSDNFLYGASVAGIYSDSPFATIIEKGNDCRDSLFGNKMEGMVGSCRLSGVYSLDSYAVEVGSPSNTSENIIRSIIIPPGILGKNGHIKIKTTWSITNNANTKLIKFKVAGTTVISQFDLSNTSVSFIDIELFNMNSISSQSCRSFALKDSGHIFSNNFSNVDTSGGISLEIAVQKSIGSDVVNLSSCCAEIIPK